MAAGARHGRKLARTFNKIGRKLVHNRAKIGRKLGRIGHAVQGVAPFLAGVPGIGPELALGAAAIGAGSSAVGRGIGARNAKELKRAGGDLAQTYGAYKSARHA